MKSENKISNGVKILIATGIFPPDIGGPATYSKLIAEEFTKLGHRVVVVSYGERRNTKSEIRNSKQIQNSKFKIIKISRKLPKGVRHFVYFCKVFWHGIGVNVIYAQDPVSVGLPVCMATWFLRKPFVLKVVGDYAWEQGVNRFGVKDLLDVFLFRDRYKKYAWQVRFLRFVQFQVAKYAKTIITPSNYLKSVIEKWGIQGNKINVVYNAVEIPDLPSKEECRKDLWLNGIVLVSVGRLVPWKGFAMLIDVMPKIIKEHLDAKLYIIGRGPEQKKLEAQIAGYNLKDRVVFVGSLPHGEVLKYLRAADIFLLNTGYEGFSHQILEAMAVGVPVTTTDEGGNREIIKDSENALIAKYKDEDDWENKIIKLIEDEGLKEKLSKNAQEQAIQYTKEKMVSKTIKILKV